MVELRADFGKTILRVGLILLFAVSAISPLLTVLLSHAIGYGYVVRAAKDLFLLLLMVPFVYLLIKDPAFLRYMFNSIVNRLIVLFGLSLILISLLSGVRNWFVTVFGFAIDLRFLIVFILAQTLGYYNLISLKLIEKIMIAVLVAVVLFGLLQIYVLPTGFMQWLGYKTGATIPPKFTIDGQATVMRIASTLRGPNELGAILITPILLLVLIIKDQIRNLQKRSWLILTLPFLGAACLVMFYSHSRSAWLGLVVAAMTVIFVKIPKKYYKMVIIGSAVAFSALFLLTYIGRSSSVVENYLLHDKAGVGPSSTSNNERLEAWKTSISAIAKRPLIGCGVGCSGPASVHANNPHINENFFLQIGQEAGIISLLIFLAILYFLLKDLITSSSSRLELIFMASLLGYIAANMLLHVWADDSLAYFWWLPLGAIVGLKYQNKKLIKP